MIENELARLENIRDAFIVADRSLDRALLHTPQLAVRMSRAARLGYASPATVERALAGATRAKAELLEARVRMDAARTAAYRWGKAVVVSFGDSGDCPPIKSFGDADYCPPSGFGDVEPIPCPQKKTGVLKDLEVAFGDHEIPGFWECGRASSVAEVAFGDHEIPSPEKKGFLANAELVAIERSLTREVNVAEGMIDRALVCTTRAIASALEERRSFRMPATFGQDVVDQLLAASTNLSKAFSELYSVHEALIEARSEAIAQAQSPAAVAA